MGGINIPGSTSRPWQAMALASALGVLVAGACTLAPTQSATPSPADAVCAEQRTGETADGEPVVICTRTHEDRPYVRPPADALVQAGRSTLYLAALRPDHRAFIGRDGTRYLPVGADRRPLRADELPASLRAPSNRDLYLVYLVSGVVDPDPIQDAETGETFTASIRIELAVPAILIEGRAIDGAFLGAWEGTVSERASDDTCTLAVPCWDDAELVPLRVSFTELVQIEDIRSLEPDDDVLADGERFALHGAVDNLVRAVMSSSGTCIGPLASLGHANPFRPSTEGDLTLYRYPAMHGPGDDELVLDYPLATEGLGGANGMSPLTVLHPANLTLEAESEWWHSISIRNHGVPNLSVINLRPVTGGGGSCTP